MNSRLIARAGRLLFLIAVLLLNRQAGRSATPANDMFANRTILPADVSQFSGNLFEATTEPGEGNFETAGSVWWKWTPAASGYALINYTTNKPQSGFYTFLIWRGDSLSELTLENFVSFFPFEPGFMYFQITAGQVYTIRLSGDKFTDRTHSYKVTTSVGPGLLSHPQKQTLKSGGAGFFHVYTGGIEHTNVTWQFNGVDIPNVYGPSYPLFNVTDTNAGVYRAVIKNSGNVTFSQDATLTVQTILPPQIQLYVPAERPWELRFHISGEFGMYHRMEISTDVLSWRPMENSELPGWPDGPWAISAPERGYGDLRLYFGGAGDPFRRMAYFRVVRMGFFKDACVANLRRLQLALEDYRIRKNALLGSFAPGEEVDKYYSQRPSCPEGGFYTYTFVDTFPTCSISTHTL